MDLLNNKLLAIHSEVKTFSEYWLRTISGMTRCSMLQIYCKAEFHKDSRMHATWIHKSYSAIIINSWSNMTVPKTAIIS